jgi:hypothetical protein
MNVVKKLMGKSLNSETTTNPKMDLDHILDWINLIQSDMTSLLNLTWK